MCKIPVFFSLLQHTIHSLKKVLDIQFALITSTFLKGAANGTRTRDPQLGKLMLYQLSYCRTCGCKDKAFF